MPEAKTPLYEPQKWQIIKSEVLLDNDQLPIIKDKVRLPNGKIGTYVRHKPTATHAVIMIVIDELGRVLLQREYSHPTGQVMWQLPGGSMRPKETIAAAARRELAEESGIGTHRTRQLGSVFTMNRISDQKQHVVECTDLFEHHLEADPDEYISSHWVTVEKLHKMISEKTFDNINLLAAINIWFHSVK